MTLLIIGFFIGLYGFARKVVKNDPLKSNIETLFEKTNSILSIYNKRKTKQTLSKLLLISNKGLLISLILSFISLLFPEKIENALIQVFGAIFILTFLFSFSIKWMQFHKNTLKEYFLNIQMLGFLFSPIIFYYLGKYPINPTINIGYIFEPFQSLIEKIGILNFQIGWLLLMVIFLYVGAIIIAVPIYLFLYLLIVVTAKIIMMIEKYIDKNILDGLVGITVIITLIVKILK